MRDLRILILPLSGALLLAPQALAHELYEPYSPGSLVGVSVEVDGRPAPL